MKYTSTNQRIGVAEIDRLKAPPYLVFPHLNEIEGLAHGIFTRQGGVSRPPFDSLNTSLSVGDDPTSVRTNRKRIQNTLEARSIVYPRQVHGRRVMTLSAGDERGRAPEADALITNQRGLFLAIQVADCQGIMLVDPVERVIANIHAGWRGSVQNIVGCAIETMIRVHGSCPANLSAAIGPSLGPCCAEFINYRREIPPHLWPYKNARQHFDFWAITRDQLAAEGVPTENIVTINLCTRCNPDQFFSYRRDNATGRFTTVIGFT